VERVVEGSSVNSVTEYIEYGEAGKRSSVGQACCQDMLVCSLSAESLHLHFLMFS
jgi:hypothetical protein